MTIHDEFALALLRIPGRCNVCGRHFAVREPHHIEPRRAGGGSRIDASWNLLSVDRSCHSLLEDGKPIQHGPHKGAALRQADQWLIVTHRDGLPLEADLQHLAWWFARLDRDASPARIGEAMKSLNEAERELARMTLARKLQESTPHVG